jgi:hypothetical protein
VRGKVRNACIAMHVSSVFFFYEQINEKRRRRIREIGATEEWNLTEGMT